MFLVDVLFRLVAFWVCFDLDVCLVLFIDVFYRWSLDVKQCLHPELRKCVQIIILT